MRCTMKLHISGMLFSFSVLTASMSPAVAQEAQPSPNTIVVESGTHYFGMLILPVLEAALYFSFAITLLISAAASTISLFWVAYAANFTPPFESGEILEASTLVLVYFIVGCLVWLLVHMLRDREEQLRRQVNDLETTRGKLIEEEKLAAVGRLASAVAHEIRNPVAIISSALETSASPSFPPNEREEMSRIAGIEAART